VISLYLHEILNDHKKNFKTKIKDSLAQKHSISSDDVIKHFGASIENMIQSKYMPLELAVDTICTTPKPVVLNIRRDRQREDTCKICESNERNIQALDEKFGDSISIFEISEDSPAGVLYHVLFQGAPDEDKKLPLTAVIHNCSVNRVWAGKAVQSSVYTNHIKKALALE
jgi:hypothetical protein